MTDKVQKIREEVVRMHNLLPVMDGDNIAVYYADRICTTLEMYIDSLQKEEPVSDDLTQEEKAELTARGAEISTKIEEYHTTINDTFNHIQLMWKAIGKAFGLENKNR